MKRIMYGLIVSLFANLLLSGCATPSTTQPKAFTNWPAGTSPAEVGKKAATSMLPRWFAARPSAHYSEDSTWMSALKFAALTKDEELKASLKEPKDVRS